MTYNKEMCKGCRYHVVDDYTMCGVDAIRNGEVCPCVECLVKTMCSEICDLFAIYVHNERYDEGDVI